MRYLVLSTVLAMLLGIQNPRDPVAEARRKFEKEQIERNYRELKEATKELAELARQLNEEVEQSSQHVISARIFDKLDRMERLAKKIREKAKGQ